MKTFIIISLTIALTGTSGYALYQEGQIKAFEKRLIVVNHTGQQQAFNLDKVKFLPPLPVKKLKGK